MSDPSPDNAVPFLAHLRPPSVSAILATQDFDVHSAVDTAYELVHEISARDGGDVLLLALAIGCLCAEITALRERAAGGMGRATAREAKCCICREITTVKKRQAVDG